MTTAEIRSMLRISHSQLDSEIETNREAWVEDMRRLGIAVDESNPLAAKSLELYCKAQFDFQGRGDEYRKLYEQLRDSMSLSQLYT